MVSVEFVFEKATKNTYRYLEVGAEADAPVTIGTLYIQKTALPTKPPRIRVTVEEVTGS